MSENITIGCDVMWHLGEDSYNVIDITTIKGQPHALISEGANYKNKFCTWWVPFTDLDLVHYPTGSR